MQVDLSKATPVETTKRTYKKRKVEDVVEERPVEGGKSIKSLPVKEKKPPTEKQLAAREKMRLARLEKIAKVKEEKERLEEEIRLKAEEVEKKKIELAEKRRLRREEKKSEIQLPAKQSNPGKVGTIDPVQPTFSEALSSMKPLEEEKEEVVEEVVEVPPSSPVRQSVTFDPRLVMAPKRDYNQRFRSYPFGKSIPNQPRFR